MSVHKKNQNKSVWLILFGLGALLVATIIIGLLLRGRDIVLLNPKGFIANEQYRLLIISTSIMLAFAAIVLFFIYFFAWKFRETNQKAVHNPAAGRSKLLFFTAWASPILIFIVLVSIMLPATQKLEPQKAIESNKEEMVVRVVAMRWKWLFIYPDQDIAAVNFVQIPVDTPVRFELTADEAPMNSFWIPHLGGMLYAMTEHVNRLNLMADTIGDYEGGAAEINGRGFAGMRFTTRVSSDDDFEQWVKETKQSTNALSTAEYEKLLKPSENHETVFYGSAGPEIYSNILSKYAGSHQHYTEPAQHGGH